MSHRACAASGISVGASPGSRRESCSWNSQTATRGTPSSPDSAGLLHVRWDVLKDLAGNKHNVRVIGKHPVSHNHSDAMRNIGCGTNPLANSRRADGLVRDVTGPRREP
jgi:hypothetical protein